MDLRQYLGTVAGQLVHELQPILGIKEVTANTDLLGKYTEAAVRNLVRRIVDPMRICTGAVLDHPMPDILSQLDLIIWAPFPAPAVFEVEGFGLVPRSSAFGVLEIKRSNYSGVEDALDRFFAAVDSKKLTADPGGAIRDYRRSAGVAVICVLESAPSARLQALIEGERVIAIFERRGDDIVVRDRDVLVLVNFLHYVTWRYRVQGSGPSYPQVDVTAFGNQ